MTDIYANEFDPKAAYWLSCLPIKFDVIDDRSIKEIKPDEVKQFKQCHFFAGIGGWPLALKLAGWPDDVPVWTGSCPCQPFSSAGKRKGTDDERHLWPEFLRLIAECKPSTIFGEQVASKAGRDWLAVVRADLEALGYAVGAADLCAASVGAPHIRQRLFWVADSNGWGRRERQEPNGESEEPRQQAPCGYDAGGRCGDGGMGDSISTRPQRHAGDVDRGDKPRRILANQERSIAQASGSCWDQVEYIQCRDGKARPVKPGVRLLAHGIPGRVAKLRGLGNAIVPQVAAEFIVAFMDSRIISDGIRVTRVSRRELSLYTGENPDTKPDFVD